MKHPVKRGALGLSLFVMALGLGSVVRADQQYLLSQLLGPSGIDVAIGDKLFYDFAFSSSATDKDGVAIAGADASKIFVTFKDPDVNGVYNILFQSASQFVAQNGGLGLGQLNMNLLFFASTTSPGWRIDGVDLSRGGVAGAGTLDIDEGVLYSGPPFGVATLSVTSPGNLFDSVSIAPSTDIVVAKSIVLNGAATGTGTTKFTDFGQSFHQTRAIPEPASCVLLGVGMLFGGVAWRRKVHA